MTNTNPMTAGRIGYTVAHARSLLDRATITLRELETPDVTAAFEGKYAALFPRDELKATYAALSDASDAFAKSYATAQLFVKQAEAEKRNALIATRSDWEAQLQNAEATAKVDIDALTAQLKSRRDEAAAEATRLCDARDATIAAIRTEADAKIERYRTEGNATATQLGTAYGACVQIYREAEAIWSANCNEEEKIALTTRVFPKMSHAKKRTVVTKTETPVVNEPAVVA